MSDRDEGLGEPRSKPTAAEWTIGFIAAAVIAAVAAVLVVDWSAGRAGDPPMFETTVKSVEKIGQLHHVEVEVRNIGDEAGAEVRVDAELELDTDTVEIDQTIAFLAPDEDTTVTFIFEDDPDDGDLSVEVSSYREP
ncbi:MAG TPA: hypothetical protein VM345_07160 [Acidimicrobiales bacterium]|jgi:uncharacterized protein (TIGR02588 family)|nr:hypothetical protein [Acidimicrobiales bacterium]